ncbi:hypothetical protein [Rhodobacter lacus]|uniref:Uncharacterized protein n=1 Tax=Rhodobacter lacus TaxID=1641972 RepID=A0ABW5A7Y0_9RHOB
MSARFLLPALAVGTGMISLLATATGSAAAVAPLARARTLQALIVFGPAALALVVALLLWHRQILGQLQVWGAQVAIRLSALRPAPAAPALTPVLTPVLAPAKHLAQGRGLEAEMKLRMTEVHRQLRARAPELLPVFADCRAAQLRLLSELRRAPAEGAQIEAGLIGGLVQIETATRKLSLVLGTATNEHALGNFADTLEKLTSETLDCLVSLRARKRAAQHGREIGGEAEHA